MIVEYFRPKSIKEALTMIGKGTPPAIPIGGGTSIREKARVKDLSVVDLQDLNLNYIEITADWMKIGATASLSKIANEKAIPEAIQRAICLEGTSNTRNLATLAGRLIGFDGRSALITTLVAADAITMWDEEEKETLLGEWLSIPSRKPGKLLVSVRISSKVSLAMEIINRTKMDIPILCVAVAKWKSGRIRVALGGFGRSPNMIFDGPDGNGAEQAAENACKKSGDFRASSKYRREMAKVLTRRCLSSLEG